MNLSNAAPGVSGMAGQAQARPPSPGPGYTWNGTRWVPPQQQLNTSRYAAPGFSSPASTYNPATSPAGTPYAAPGFSQGSSPPPLPPPTGSTYAGAARTAGPRYASPDLQPRSPVAAPAGNPYVAAAVGSRAGDTGSTAVQAAGVEGPPAAQTFTANPSRLSTGAAQAAPNPAFFTSGAPQYQTPEQSKVSAQLQELLGGQLAGGFTGNDPMTQSLLADYDAQQARARQQQIEDLQRFGVLGGDQGASAGATADVLGTFDAAGVRGRSATRAAGIQTQLNAILPQAQSLGQFQDIQSQTAALQNQQLGQQSSQFNASQAQQAAQFAQGLGLDYASLNQQDRQFIDSQVQLNQQFNAAQQQQGSQFGAGLAEQAALRRQQNTQFNAGQQQQAGQFGQSLAEQVAARQQQGYQFNAAQNQEAQQFAQSLGLDYASLNQQDRQFIDQITQQGAQFGASLGEQQAGRLQQGAQFNAAQQQQSAQYAQSLGLDYASLSQQDRQFIDAQAQQAGQFGASLGEQQATRLQQGGQFNAAQQQQAAQFAQSIGLDYSQLSQQDRQFVDSLAEQQATRLQQGTQFDQSLGEQQAARLQQNTQFGLGRQDQINQFEKSLGQSQQSLDQQLAALLGQTAGGQKTLAGLGRQDQINQFNKQLASQESLQNRQLRLAEEELYGGAGTRATLAARQFSQSMGLDYDRLSQQDRQFVDSLAEQKASRQQQQGQFTAQNRLAEEALYGGAGNRSTLEARLGNQQLTQQGSQFDRSLNLEQTAQQQQQEAARIQQIIAAQQAGISGFDQVNIASQLRALLGLSETGEQPKTNVPVAGNYGAGEKYPDSALMGPGPPKPAAPPAPSGKPAGYVPDIAQYMAATQAANAKPAPDPNSKAGIELAYNKGQISLSEAKRRLAELGI